MATAAECLEPLHIERLLWELTACAELSVAADAPEADVRLQELADLADVLEASCDAPDALIDRHEQQLDATTFERLANAWDVLMHRALAAKDAKAARRWQNRAMLARERAVSWRKYEEATEANAHGDWPETKARFEVAVDHRRQLVAADPRLQLRLELIDVLDEAGMAYQAAGDLEAAATYFDEALRLLVDLRQARSAPIDAWAHGIIASKAGVLARQRGRLDEAAGHFAVALCVETERARSAEEPEEVEQVAARTNPVARAGVCLAQVHLERGDATACASALAQAQPWIPSVEHPELTDGDPLDTAASFYETQAQAAEATGDRKLAKAAAKSAAGLRARIAALTEGNAT